MPQISATTTQENLEYIKEVAKREKRTESQVAALLIDAAIREKERQRLKNNKKNRNE